MHERGHHEVAPSVADQAFNLALIVAFPRAAITVPDDVVRKHGAEPLRALARTIRHNLGHKAAVIVVQNGTRNCLEESKGMNMSVQPALLHGSGVKC